MDIEICTPQVRENVLIEDVQVKRHSKCIEIEGVESQDELRKLFNYFNGEMSVRKISDDLNVDVNDMVSLCGELNSHGFIWLNKPSDFISVSDFKSEFSVWLERWVEVMYSQDVWKQLNDGIAPGNIIIGWAIENMHYTRTVCEHMTKAAVHSSSTKEGEVLMNHFSEEWDHFYLFRDACVATGLSVELLEQSKPLASTQAITNFMRVMSTRHALVYNACEALLEATTAEGAGVVEYYKRLGKNYDLPDAFVNELIRHINVDADFGHIDIFDGLLDDDEMISRELMLDIMNSCNILAELFVCWNTEISDFYGVRSNQELHII